MNRKSGEEFALNIIGVLATSSVGCACVLEAEPAVGGSRLALGFLLC
jgi:hypothetical protein